MIITNSQFKDDIYTRDNQLPPTTNDAQFFSMLQRAIINVRQELKAFEPETFEVWLENQTSPVAFPDDLERGEQVLFYRKDQFVDPVGGQLISERQGSWHVDLENFNIKYSKDIPLQTDLEADFPFKTVKSIEILISEMMALINLAYEQNEATAAVGNALTQSNRVK
jgi:hypothetical protein